MDNPVLQVPRRPAFAPIQLGQAPLFGKLPHPLRRQLANADFDDAQIRDSVLEYFVDKIYLYDDHIVITGYYSDIHHELMYDELYGDNNDGSSGFIYDENPGSGFVYLADGGTT